jgi:hypothetical protein
MALPHPLKNPPPPPPSGTVLVSNACLACPLSPRSSYHVADTSVVTTGRPLSRVPALGVSRRVIISHATSHTRLFRVQMIDNDLWVVIKRR